MKKNVNQGKIVREITGILALGILSGCTAGMDGGDGLSGYDPIGSLDSPASDLLAEDSPESSEYPERNKTLTRESAMEYAVAYTQRFQDVLPGELRYLKTVGFAEPGRINEPEVSFNDRKLEPEEQVRPSMLRVGIGVDEHLFVYEAAVPEGWFDDDNSELLGFDDDSSLSAARSDDEAELEDVVLKAWGGGTDERIRRSVKDGFDFYDFVAYYGGCSAAILGKSRGGIWALTAAHCLFPSNGDGAVSSNTLDPERFRGDRPYGAWRRHGIYKFDPRFLEMRCFENFRTACISADIAVVQFFPPDDLDYRKFWPGTIGWAKWSKSSLKGKKKYSRGYPACGDAGAPKRCTPIAIYGSGAFGVGEIFDNDTWLSTSDDISPGQSGSGLYARKKGVKYAFGVQSAHERNCYEGCDNPYPNYARKIDRFWFFLISSLVNPD